MADLIRPGLHQLDGSGATDGDVATWSAGQNRWVPLATADVHDARWDPQPSESTIDEFNNSSLDAAWSQVDSGAGNVVWTEGADVLSGYANGTDASAQVNAMMRPLSGAGGSLATGDGFATGVTLLSDAASGGVCGLLFADGNTYMAGTQMLGRLYQASGYGSAMYTDLAADAASGYTIVTAAGTPLTPYPRSSPIYLRLAYLGSNSWRVDVSPDGVSWIRGTASTLTFTPTYVGLFVSSWGTTAQAVAAFEFLRRVSGVT